MSTTRHQVVVGDHPVEWVEQAGHGTPLILLHGCGGHAESFAALMPCLHGLRVCVPSLPGRKGSGGPPLTSVGAMAEWLQAWMAAAGLRDAVVGGHSLGGAVALELALSNTPPRALVLMNTGARLRVLPEILEHHRAAAERGGVEEVPPAATHQDWIATHAFDRMQDVARIGTRTLVLGGTADDLTPPKYAWLLHERIAGSQLRMVEGADHFMPVRMPEEVGSVIRAFAALLDGHP